LNSIISIQKPFKKLSEFKIKNEEMDDTILKPVQNKDLLQNLIITNYEFQKILSHLD